MVIGDCIQNQNELSSALENAKYGDIIIIENLRITNLYEMCKAINISMKKGIIINFKEYGISTNTEFGCTFVSAVLLYAANIIENIELPNVLGLLSSEDCIIALKNFKSEFRDSVVEYLYSSCKSGELTLNISEGTKYKNFNVIVLTGLHIEKLRSEILTGYLYVEQSGKLSYIDIDSGNLKGKSIKTSVNNSNCRAVILEDGKVYVYSMSRLCDNENISINLMEDVKDIRAHMLISSENELKYPVVFENIVVATKVLTGKIGNAKLLWQLNNGGTVEERNKSTDIKHCENNVTKMDIIRAINKSQKFELQIEINLTNGEVKVLKCWYKSIIGSSFKSLDEFLNTYIQKAFGIAMNSEVIKELIINDLYYNGVLLKDILK